jgi:hypothetical protein
VDALKQGGRSATSGPSSQRVRNILVVTEMAMSLILLVGATLLVRSIIRLERQSLGIRQDHWPRERSRGSAMILRREFAHCQV